MTLTSATIIVWITRAIIRAIFKFDPVVVAGSLVYGSFLVLLRFITGILQRAVDLYRFIIDARYEDGLSTVPPSDILEYSRYYKLTGLKVILDQTARLKVDLGKYHTLIAGLTRSGKTWAISSIILQIVTRPDFFQKYRLFIFDLKPGDNDYLSRWKTIATYFTVDEDGSTETAVNELGNIVNKYTVDGDGRKIVVIIDELAMLTTFAINADLRRRGKAALAQLSAQLGSRGNIIGATQHPDYKILPRSFTAQFERKICLRVDDRDVADLILRRKPSVDPSIFADGEFVMREPTRREIEILGKFPEIDLPRDIDRALAMVNDIDASDDVRMRCLTLTITGLRKGDRLPGINRVKSADMPVPFLEMARRNFVMSGAAKALPDRNGNVAHYVLDMEPGEAVTAVKKYIADGRWEQDPEPIKF